MKLFQTKDVLKLQEQIDDYRHCKDRYLAWLIDKKVPEELEATDDMELLSFVVQSKETQILNDWMWHMYLFARTFGLTIYHMVDNAKEGYRQIPIDLISLFSLCINTIMRETEHTKFVVADYLPSSRSILSYGDENPFVAGRDKIIVILTMITNRIYQDYTKDDLEEMSEYVISFTEYLYTIATYCTASNDTLERK